MRVEPRLGRVVQRLARPIDALLEHEQCLAVIAGEAGSGNRGLSLFIIPKPAFDGHQWEYEQPEGGKISGTANPTPGYRGMHSFTLAIDNLWVPHDNLVGGDDGVGQDLESDHANVRPVCAGGDCIGVAIRIGAGGEDRVVGADGEC